jgi:hypothetical protein
MIATNRNPFGDFLAESGNRPTPRRDQTSKQWVEAIMRKRRPH